MTVELALESGILAAALGCVSGDDVVVSSVSTFDDVELATPRPVGAVRPDYRD